VNGFITTGGQKMSKSLGNVISPEEMVEKFGVDGTRYLLLNYGAFGEDTDVSWAWLQEKYNADLANGLGNLVSRTIKMGEKINCQNIGEDHKLYVKEIMDNLEIGQAIDSVWREVKNLNKYIEDNKPWELQKTDQKKFEEVIHKLFYGLCDISSAIAPFMPETAEKIKKALKTKELIVLFPRIK
jgi:methionyl-tRNA synthetase